MSDEERRPLAVIVMGPSGVGKTTTAEMMAQKLGWPYGEADAFHPAKNIAKMESGHPLNDEDRAPWLAKIRDHITEEAGKGVSIVMTCSALKKKYRDVLRGADARVRFVALTGDPKVVASRMEKRKGHYMPPSLLKSQFDDLEPLEAAEDGVVVDVDASPQDVVDKALKALELAPAAAP